MTLETLGKGLEVLAGAWPTRQPTEATLNAYWIALKGMDDSVFEAAIGRCLTECSFFPVPAEIIQRATAVLTESGQLPPESETAWELVMAAMKDYSVDNGWLGLHPEYPALGRVYGMPCPLPQVVQDALYPLGGMSRICVTPEKDLGWVRKEFMEHYERIRHREITYGGVLLGDGRRPAAALNAGRAG